MKKRILVSCECEGTGFIAVADNGGEGVEHVECGQHAPRQTIEFVRKLTLRDDLSARLKMKRLCKELELSHLTTI
jgi:hypothetical protein